MFAIILFMLIGLVLGYMLRQYLSGWLQQLVSVLIWLLLFTLGIEVGGNPQIVQGLHAIGLEALCLAVAGTFGSVIAANLLWRWVRVRYSSNPSSTDSFGHCGEAAREERIAMWQALRGSLVIAFFFAIGLFCAVLGLIPEGAVSPEASFYALGALMASVGATIGSNPQTIRQFRHQSPRLLLLPLCTIGGTLIGCAMIAFGLHHRSLTDCLAVGSGMGYYSLSSIFITQYRGAELGTVALLANIIRELLTLFTAPLLVHWFGRLAPIAAGGATTMDTTLPVITRTSGKELVIVSIFHGFVTDFSVPFLVTLWCSF